MKSLNPNIVYLVVACAAYLACGDTQPDGRGTDGRGTDGRDPLNRIPVETHVIRTGEVVRTVRGTGTVQPKHDIVVSAQTAGTVVAVEIDLGDAINNGQVLVRIDDELKRLALQQAEAQRLQAEAAYEKARKDFERNKKLFETRDISEYVFENARLQMKSAEAAYLTAKANEAMARRHLADTRVVSPIAGVVAARMVDVGSTVAPGTPVARIVDLSQVKVTFGVPEEDRVQLQRDQPAILTVDAYPGARFEGKVSGVGPQADPATRTFPVEVRIDNPGGRLKGGMTGRVEVVTRKAQDARLLPKSALLERRGETLVFVVRDGVAEKHTPKLGLESGEYITVRDGLNVGDEVIVLGQEQLTDGSPVSVKRRE